NPHNQPQTEKTRLPRADRRSLATMSTNRNNPNRNNSNRNNPNRHDNGRPAASRPSASVGTRNAPAISIEQARREGVRVSSLIAVARWNEQRAEQTRSPRLREQAAELRRVAAQLAAENDNARNDTRRVA